MSCNSSNNENASSTDSTTTEIGGVQNVNGNILDTSMGELLTHQITSRMWIQLMLILPVKHSLKNQKDRYRAP